MKALAHAIIPGDGKEFFSAANDSTVLLIDTIIAEKEKKIQRQLKLYLWLVQLGPWLFYCQPFSALSDDLKRRWLKKLECSPLAKIRLGFWGLKNLIMMAYYTQDAIWPAIGYDGPVIEKEGGRREATADSTPINVA